MFDEFAALRPLKEAANIIAEMTDWPALYSKKQLNANKVYFLAFNLDSSSGSPHCSHCCWLNTGL